MTAITETLPKPAKLSPREKAAATDEAARAIIDAEANKREKKTERLRQMRLEREATAEKIAGAAAKTKKAVTKKASAKNSRAKAAAE